MTAIRRQDDRGSGARRFAIVDGLRGLAAVQMIVFHTAYALNQFRWIALEVNRDEPWATWRLAIVSQFLLLVGVSQALRASRDPGRRAFWRRWAQIAAAAAAVTFGSGLFFDERMIRFGILHFVAVALLIAQPSLRLGAWNLALGAAAIVLGASFADVRFDHWPAEALGFTTRPPQREDHVPLFPWLGVVWLGLGLGALWRARGFALAPGLAALAERAPGLVRWLGRWPLTVYLGHVPVIVAVLWAVGLLLRLAGAA